MILPGSPPGSRMVESFCDIAREGMKTVSAPSRIFSFLRRVELDWLQIARGLLDARINDLSSTNRKGVNMRIN